MIFKKKLAAFNKHYAKISGDKLDPYCLIMFSNLSNSFIKSDIDIYHLITYTFQIFHSSQILFLF